MRFFYTKWAIPVLLILCGMASCVSIFATPEQPLTDDGKEIPTYNNDPNYAIRSNCRVPANGVTDQQAFDCVRVAWDRAHWTALKVAKEISSSGNLRKHCLSVYWPDTNDIPGETRKLHAKTLDCLQATADLIDEESMHSKANEMGAIINGARRDIGDAFQTLPRKYKP